MKIILVTSDLTYVPNNYNDVFEHVVRNSYRHIATVVFVRINKLPVLAKLPYLYFAGCKNMSITLTHNFFDVFSGKKKAVLKKLRIPFISTKNINNKKTILKIQTIKPDLILNMRARCIYKDAVLKIPRLGCVNIHHGILPYQRGVFCDLYALAENRTTGFTIHQMTNHIDHGKILYQERVDKNRSYVDYLSRVVSKEKMAITKFIERTARDSFLQEATVSYESQQPSFTRTPDFRTIKKIQRQGIIL